MKLFLSWSGERSRQLARALRWFLPEVSPRLSPWMSDVDVPRGARWAVELDQQLKTCTTAVICVTPENQSAPWLLFEAGAMSNQMGAVRVCPLLLGMQRDDVVGPLTAFQATLVDRDELRTLALQLNQALGPDALPERTFGTLFDTHWPEFEARVRQAAGIGIPGSQSNVDAVVTSFRKAGLPTPDIGNHVYFTSGFESHKLYACAFSVASRRIYIWGRKNRKVFDKEYRDFLAALPARLRAGFDFRVLFLDPDSDEAVLDRAHRDADFRLQLRGSLDAARQSCEHAGVDFGALARLYRGSRAAACMVVDDAVVFAPLGFDPEGRAAPLTRAPFSIFGADSAQGSRLVADFVAAWDAARPAA